jgi:hypothetical protein
MAKPKASLTAALAQKQPSPAAAEPERSTPPGKRAKVDDGKLVTSLYLRAELMTELKILAVQRRCRVNDVVVEAIENLLELNGRRTAA